MSANGELIGFIRRTLIVLVLVALALFLWRIAYALLLAFGGVLVAVFLRGLATLLHERTRLSMGWSLAIVGGGLVGLLVLGALLMGPAVASEMSNLGSTLTQGVEKIQGFLEQQPWGKQLLSGMSQNGAQGGDVLRAVASVVVSATDAILALLLVLFAGAYFAVSPCSYAEGLVRLLPEARRARVMEVMDTAAKALWYWLIGRFVIMVIVAVLTTVALLVVGVPLAPVLGIIAGLLEFVPFIGPIAAAVPILLVALTADPQTALHAAVAVLVVQQTESNLLEPLVERRAVSLPPVLVLVGTIAFALLFGIIGAVFASPLLVVVVVAVKMLYMEDVLGERAKVPGRDPA